MIVYVSGLYTQRTETTIDENIQEARRVAIEIWELGNTCLCPHLNTAHFEVDCSIGYEDYIRGDLELLARCDAIVMLSNWKNSPGAKVEREFAEQRGIPVYEYPFLPLSHPTEQRRPQQVAAFIDTVMQMYRTHLNKNADYSPANILGAGELGLMTRTWDKVSRLMNLMGFKIEISESHFAAPETPKCESIEDSILDMGVYSIIWRLFRQGKWGR